MFDLTQCLRNCKLPTYKEERKYQRNGRVEGREEFSSKPIQIKKSVEITQSQRMNDCDKIGDEVVESTRSYSMALILLPTTVHTDESHMLSLQRTSLNKVLLIFHTVEEKHMTEIP